VQDFPISVLLREEWRKGAGYPQLSVHLQLFMPVFSMAWAVTCISYLATLFPLLSKQYVFKLIPGRGEATAWQHRLVKVSCLSIAHQLLLVLVWAILSSSFQDLPGSWHFENYTVWGILFLSFLHCRFRAWLAAPWVTTCPSAAQLPHVHPLSSRL
jgi:hypothetical protein